MSFNKVLIIFSAMCYNVFSEPNLIDVIG